MIQRNKAKSSYYIRGCILIGKRSRMIICASSWLKTNALVNCNYHNALPGSVQADFDSLSCDIALWSFHAGPAQTFYRPRGKTKKMTLNI